MLHGSIQQHRTIPASKTLAQKLDVGRLRLSVLSPLSEALLYLSRPPQKAPPGPSSFLPQAGLIAG